MTEYECVECGVKTKYTFDNGDNKKRCEACSTAKYQFDCPASVRTSVKTKNLALVDLWRVA